LARIAGGRAQQQTAYVMKGSGVQTMQYGKICRLALIFGVILCSISLSSPRSIVPRRAVVVSGPAVRGRRRSEFGFVQRKQSWCSRVVGMTVGDSPKIRSGLAYTRVGLLAHSYLQAVAADIERGGRGALLYRIQQRLVQCLWPSPAQPSL
jgi:hypothetical protein